jgi:hypothetical protein
MADKFATNFPIPSSTNIFATVWKLTRVMKAAGWIYKASGNQIAKDTTGTASNDYWGANADPTLDIYSNVSSWVAAGSNGVNINTFAGAGTLNVGATTNFASSGVVWVMTSAGYQLLTYQATTATTLTGVNNPAGTSATLTGGSQGTGAPVANTIITRYTDGSVTLPQTSIPVATTSGFLPSGTIYVQTTGAGSANMQAVTYTGISGNTFTGCSGGTGTVLNSAIVASGAPTIGLDQCTAWIVLSGPQTLKIPLNALPTGILLRGETITQATTGAEGELLGFVWDSVGGSGWAAVLPRTGTFNMTTANTITGSTSGATFAPLNGGTMITFNREIMIAKDTGVLSGAIYYGCFDSVGENAQMFSVLATQAGCTGAVGPGQGGTSNGFPAKGIVCRGAAGATTVGSLVGGISNFQNCAQIAATNCTPATGLSADGSFYIGLPTSGLFVYGFAFFRLEDTEPGDCDPYVFLTNNSTSNSSLTNSTSSTANVSAGTYPAQTIRATLSQFFGYQSRGNGTLDTFNAYAAMPQSDIFGNTWAILGLGPVRIVNTPATSRPIVAENIALYSAGLASVTNSKPQYKGRCRWLLAASFGGIFDLYFSKTLISFSVNNGSLSNATILVGPYDGVTIPIQ